MDENLTRGYVHFSRRHRGSERDHDAPRDNYHMVYLGLVLAGIGFLVPYNSFIIACDYFQDKYPKSLIIFDMSMGYILVAFIAVCINNVLVEAVPFSTRIAFGYFVSCITLIFVLIFEIGWDIFDLDTGYDVNLIAVAVIAFGCTVQQSSFYGYTSMLPARYTQAVMIGESAAGLIASFNRIVTKSILENERINTMLFFSISIAIILSCIVTYSKLQSCAFVTYYLRQHRTQSTVSLNEPLQSGVRSELLNKDESEDVHLVDTVDDDGAASRVPQNAVLSFRSPPTSPAAESGDVNPLTEAFADPRQMEEELANYGLAAHQIRWLSNNDLDMSDGRHRFKVQDVVVKFRSSAATKRVQWFSAIRQGIMDRIQVARCILPYMLTISMAYLVTLCLFPGIESKIVSCRLKNWMPVILMAIFNVSDFFGKMIAPFSYKMRQQSMLFLSLIRLILVPCLAMCALHGAKTTLMDDLWAMFLSLVLGVSNGVLGSVPMIVAPSKVPHQFRELTGNIMTLSYSVGLTMGSLLAYLIQSWVRSRRSPVSCAILEGAILSATRLVPRQGDEKVLNTLKAHQGIQFTTAANVTNPTFDPLTTTTATTPISAVTTLIPKLVLTTISTYLNVTTVETNGQS